MKPYRSQRQTGSALVWILVVIALALTGIVGYWYYDPRTVPWWAENYLPALKSDATTLYKWQDNKGQWHVGDTPPEGVSFQEIDIHHDTNVMPTTDAR